MKAFLAFIEFLKAMFGFGKQVSENKGEREKHMAPKFVQKGINQAAILKNRLTNKRRKWVKRQERIQKREDRREDRQEKREDRRD